MRRENQLVEVQTSAKEENMIVDDELFWIIDIIFWGGFLWLYMGLYKSAHVYTT